MVEGVTPLGTRLNIGEVLSLIPAHERLVALVLIIAFFLVATASWAGLPRMLVGGASLFFALLLFVAAIIYVYRAQQRLEATANRVRTVSVVQPAVSNGPEAGELDAASESATASVDTFFAAPMASAKDYDNADEAGPRLLMILEALRETGAAGDIYYGGKLIKHQTKFDREPDGYLMSSNALEQAQRFMLIWPRDLATSALFELGVAKARKLPTTIFYKNRDDLPYLLRGRHSLGFADDWPVNFAKFETVQDIVDQILLQRDKIFPSSETVAP